MTRGNMTLRSYLLIMIITTVFLWGGFLFVSWTINPEITNWLGFLLFYVSLFFAISGTAAIVGFIVRFIGLKRELAWYSVSAAFRQSFIFAFLIVATLFLLSKDLFTWYNLIFLVIGLTILEYFLISYSTRNTKDLELNAEIDNLNNE